MCHDFKTCGEVIELRTILVCWVSGSTPKEEAAIFQSDEPTPNRHEIKAELQPGYSYSNGIRTAMHTANSSNMCQKGTYLQQITSHMIPWHRQHLYMWVDMHIYIAVHRIILMDIQCTCTYIAMKQSIARVHVYICTWIYWEAQLPRPWMALKPKCSTVTQCTGCVSVNTRLHQLCWGDWECGHYTGLCTNLYNVHVSEQHCRTDGTYYVYYKNKLISLWPQFWIRWSQQDRLCGNLQTTLLVCMHLKA